MRNFTWPKCHTYTNKKCWQRKQFSILLLLSIQFCLDRSQSVSYGWVNIFVINQIGQPQIIWASFSNPNQIVEFLIDLHFWNLIINCSVPCIFELKRKSEKQNNLECLTNVHLFYIITSSNVCNFCFVIYLFIFFFHKYPISRSF